MSTLRDDYINLLRDTLTMSIWNAGDGSLPIRSSSLTRRAAMYAHRAAFYLKGGKRAESDDKRETGGDWPRLAHTMIGRKRMSNLQFCVEDVLKKGVQGDFIETGVWRGGASIFMRGILRAHEVSDRKVWVADSFEGLPRPNDKKYPADRGDDLHSFAALAVGLDQVRENFRRYGLLDEQVEFLQGWFSATLPTAPIKSLAVARLDGDLYESTMDALVNLYPKISVGGYVIIDDYHALANCKQAVTDYREKHGISDEIQEIDGVGAFWQVSSAPRS